MVAVSLAVALLRAVVGEGDSDLTGPIPLSEFLKKLSSHDGQSYTAIPELAGRLLFVRGEDVIGSRVLEFIADGTCGKWERLASGQRLVFDAERRKALEQRLKDLRKRAIDEELGRLCDDPRESSPQIAERLVTKLVTQVVLNTGEVSPETIARTSGLFPAGLICRQLLREIGASGLSAVRSGETVVYCTSPARRELALPERARSRLAQLNDAFVRANSILEAKPAPVGKEELWQRLTACYRACSGDVEVILAVSRAGELWGARCEVYAGGPNVDTGFCTLEPRFPVADLDVPAKKIKLSLRSEAAAIAIPKGLNGTFSDLDSSIAKDMLSPPEPLRFFIPEALSALRQGPIVALLPDSAFMCAFRAVSKDTLDLSTFWSAVSKVGITAKLSDGCLILAPIAPSLLDGQGDVRRALRTHLLADESYRSVSVKNYFRYCASAVRGQGTVGGICSAIPALMTSTGWRILRPSRGLSTAFLFLETLSDRQLHSLEAGQKLSLQDLSPVQIAWLEEWIKADLYGGFPFSSAGIRRLSSSGRWSISVQVQSAVSLVARPINATGAWAPRVNLTLAGWRRRVADWSIDTGVDKRTLLNSVEWYPTEARTWSLTVAPDSLDPGCTASFSWSAGGGTSYLRWNDLSEDVRNSILEKDGRG